MSARRSAAALLASAPIRVEVNANDLVTVLDQRQVHAHDRPGFWDDDNPPGKAGTRCEECAARVRLARTVLSVLGPSS